MKQNLFCPSNFHNRRFQLRVFSVVNLEVRHGVQVRVEATIVPPRGRVSSCAVFSRTVVVSVWSTEVLPVRWPVPLLVEDVAWKRFSAKCATKVFFCSYSYKSFDLESTLKKGKMTKTCYTIRGSV